MKNLITTFFLCFIFAGVQAQICPPPEACADAPLFCGFSMQNEVFNNAVPIVPGAFDPLCGPNFTTHNSNWFRIVPCSPNLVLMINVITTTTGDGLQTALYSDCQSSATVACNPGDGAFAPLMLSATVTPGQEYYLQIDGYSADICDYTITVLSGIQTAPPPPPVAVPYDGNITSSPSGPAFCSVGTVQFSADWPGCSTFQSPQLSCYEPEEDSCKGIKWTFPQGTVFIGDPYANPVTVSFQNVAPGNYIIKARPMDCACPDDLCPNCGQICCPVNEIEYPVSIVGPLLTVLPEIEVCPGEPWPPACAQNVNGNQAVCTVSSNPVLCEATIQPYKLLPAVVNNIGVVTICDGDSVTVCDTVFTTSGIHTYQCSCDSTVTVTIIKDLSCGNDCVSYNFPAPPGDHCEDAPFLCGNYLDGYCTSNFGFDDDLINSFLSRRGGFIRFAPCDESVNLQIAVRNCDQNVGMRFLLAEDACEMAQFFSAIDIFNNNTGNLMATGLEPDSTYFIVFSGLSGNQCEFEFSVIDGVGTGTPGMETCVCTDGSVSGPADVCPGDIVSYTLSPGSCTSTTTPGEPGNGYYCCPETTPADSLHLVWHIPPFMSFLSDSIDVTTITVQVNPDLIGVDTMAHDSVWISYELSTPLPPGSSDTLIFCDCPALAGCIPGMAPAPVFMHHNIDQELCFISCYDPICIIDGVVYFSPGQYVEQTNCETRFITILGDTDPPFFTIPPPAILTCTNPTVTLFANGSNFSIKTWSGPGVPAGTTGNTLTVSLPGIYFCTATNPGNGCTWTANVMVLQDINPPVVVVSPNVTICAGETTSISATSNISFSTFIWSSGQTGSTVAVTPASTTAYTVTVTNTINGCTSTASITVTVNPVQINQLGEVGQITCTIPCITFMGNTYCAPGSYEIQENPCLIHRFSVGFDPAPIPVVYPTVTLCAGECYNFLGQNICSAGVYTFEENCNLHIQEINITPSVQLSASASPVLCNGENATLSADATGGTTPFTFQWDSGQTGPIIAVNPPASTTYTVTATDTNGCTATQQVSVIVPAALQVSSIPQTIICEGETAVLTAAATGGTAPYLYNWSNGAQVSPTQTTTYTVTVTDSNGCTATVESTVNVTPLQVVQLGVAGQVSCSNPCFVFMGNNFCLPGSHSVIDNCVQFDFEIVFAKDTINSGIVGNITCTQNCITFQGQNHCQAGNYTVEDSCSVYHFQITQDLVPPTVSIAPPPVICPGSSVTITANSNIPQSQFAWDNGQNGPAITVAPTAATTYTVTVTDPANGCTGSATVAVNVDPPVIVAPMQEVTICVGEAASLNAVASGGTAPYFYQWSTGEQVAQINVSPVETATFTVTVTDAIGCTTSTSAVVTVTPMLIVQSGVVGQVSCSNPCFSFQGNTYCLPGQYVLNENCTQTQFEIAFARDTVNAGVAGTITCAANCVSFQGQSYCLAGNYSVSDSCNIYLFSVLENLTPPACSSPSLNCLPGNNNYTVGFTIAGTQPYKVNGAPIVGNYYLSEPVANGQQYNFIVEQTSNGCQVLLTGEFDCGLMCTGESGVLSAASISACVDQTVSAVVISPALPAPGQSAVFILHKGSAGQLGDILEANTSGVFVFDPAIMQAENTYFISSVVGVPDGNGQIDMTDACTRVSQGQPVIFHPHPLFVHISAEPPACFGLNDGVITINASGALPMVYNLNAGAWAESPVFEGLEAGVFTLGLRDGNNCAADSTVVLEQPDDVWLSLGPDLEIFQGEKVVLVPQTNAESPVFNWSDDLSNIEVTGPTRTAQPAENTRYSCTVTDGNGCTAVTSLLVKVKPQGLYTPNVITPETGDAINQKFTLFAAEGYADRILSLEIFDRWGEAVFMQKNFPPNEPAYGWDGTNRGKKLRPDVFTFLALVQLYDGSVKVVKGDVTVVR